MSSQRADKSTNIYIPSHIENVGISVCQAHDVLHAGLDMDVKNPAK
ncbi:MAG: hypothetical protein KAS64_02335 [Spirochaetes bacterium]|nr:hypothetical protein [Spirochaetota bacterium]